MKKIGNHFLYHFLQISVLALGFIAFIRLQGEIRLIVLMFTIFSYVSIALFHQFINHNLHLKIVVEYLLMGGLFASIIFFVLEGGIGL